MTEVRVAASIIGICLILIANYLIASQKLKKARANIRIKSILDANSVS